MTQSTTSQPDSRVTAIEALSTLFALGREVTSVLDLDELLQKIPELIARLTKFQAFAVYLLDARGEELTIAYSVGYPEELARTLRVKVGQGLVGAAVAEGHPLLVNDVHADPRYVEAVPGSNAELVVPLAAQGARHRRVESAQRHRRAIYRDRRGDPASVCRACGGRDRERTVVRARAGLHEHARNARRGRPRFRRASSTSTSC